MRLVVFAKAPVPGCAKTRLIPALGADGAARLHRHLVRRALATAVESGLGPVELWCAPDTGHPFFAECAAAFGCSLHAQPPGDLGLRMREGLEAGLPALLLGSDAPGLTAEALRAAARELEQGRDAVLIPATDGGYVLIGLTRPAPGLFEDMPWGGPTVLEETRRRATRCALDLTEGPPCPDIDLPEDLVHCPPQWLGELRAAAPGREDRGG